MKDLAETSAWRAYPIHLDWPGGESRLDFHVLFNTIATTRAALATAGRLARNLGGRIWILVAQVVPYPLPLSEPPVSIEFTTQTLLKMAQEQPSETRIKVYLCRDREQTIRQVLGPEAVVVLGGPKHWWLTREQRLARRLERAGHKVIFVDPRQAGVDPSSSMVRPHAALKSPIEI